MSCFGIGLINLISWTCDVTPGSIPYCCLSGLAAELEKKTKQMRINKPAEAVRQNVLESFLLSSGLVSVFANSRSGMRPAGFLRLFSICKVDLDI